MTTAQFLPLLLLFMLFGKSKPKPVAVYHPAFHPPAPAPPYMPPGLVPALHPSMAPPPWPVGMPAGLPPFPGPGWVPDHPPPADVQARALALLPQLWRQGQGAHTTEQTGGRWITYLATMIGTRRSVVAYRMSTPAAPLAPMPPITSSSPGLVPAVYAPAPAGVPHAAAVPVAAPAGPVHIPASPPAGPVHALPTLKLTSPRMTGPAVIYLEGKLGVKQDGTYGTGDVTAVRHFQATHVDPLDGKPLKQDGVVGPATWRALG